MGKSRFSLHYLLAGSGKGPEALSDKLLTILKERFPDDVFLRVFVPDSLGEVPDQFFRESTLSGFDGTIAPKVLLIGIGMGGLVAYRLQRLADYRGISVIAVCPPPGVGFQPEGGPKVVIFGSKYGVYGTSVIERKFKQLALPGSYDTQVYGIPAFIHGPGLAVYATAYLVGKYMTGKDLSPEVMHLVQ